MTGDELALRLTRLGEVARPWPPGLADALADYTAALKKADRCEQAHLSADLALIAAQGRLEDILDGVKEQ